MFRDLEGLVSITEATPEPRAGEVVVRVGATSLNYRDHAILMGWSPFPTKAGLVPVSDAAGVVEAVGEGEGRPSRSGPRSWPGSTPPAGRPEFAGRGPPQ